MSKLITVDGKPIKFQIWDTAGQEKYHSLARKSFALYFLYLFLTLYFFTVSFFHFLIYIFPAMYYRGAAAAILVYDITQAQSFERLKNWVLELQSKGPAELALAIAGNKSDLKDQRVSLWLNLKHFLFLSFTHIFLF